MSEIPQELIDGLAGHYELRGVVGRGGMATVYGATDLKHNRDVAIKVLKPELSATLGAERFLREIEIAAQLQHPHILMLIDSGQTGDTFYYVMPLVDGGSLRNRIDDGILDIEHATSITAKVADALGYAHRQGVVHRDIKPENILFSSGHPVVGDFGIAKAISTAGATALTRTGFPLGTVGYMSPEQAAGSTELGPASDVYSLACVTYEMLVGAVPGVWLSDEESDAGRLEDIPEKHRISLDKLPRFVEVALARALARRPVNRFTDPSDFLAALTGKELPPPRPPQGTANRPLWNSRPPTANSVSDEAQTIGAIVAAAADVGLSTDRIMDAIEQVDSTVIVLSPLALFSLPENLDMETIVSGEIPRSEFATLLDVIQKDLRSVGEVDEVAGRLSWNNRTWESEGTHITVTPKGGQTKLVITESAGGYKNAVTAGSFIASALLTFLVVGLGNVEGVITTARAFATAVALVGGSSFATTFVAGRFFLRRILRARRDKLGKLLANLADASRKAIGAPPALAAAGDEKDVKKQFSEQQVDRIIQHAAESQFANPTTDGNLTVGAIESIAADVGLSPQRVHEAIMQLDPDAKSLSPTDSSGVEPFAGGFLKEFVKAPLPSVQLLFSSSSPLEMEATIDGEFPRDEFGALLDEIRMNLKDSGRFNEARGNSLSWTSSPLWDMPNGVGVTHITVHPRRGKTKISIAERTGPYHVGATIASVLSGGVVAAAILTAGETGLLYDFGVAINAAIVGAGFSAPLVAGRFYLRRVLKKRRKELEGLLSKLVGVSLETIDDDATGS